MQMQPTVVVSRGSHKYASCHRSAFVYYCNSPVRLWGLEILQATVCCAEMVSCLAKTCYKNIELSLFDSWKLSFLHAQTKLPFFEFFLMIFEKNEICQEYVFGTPISTYTTILWHSSIVFCDFPLDCLWHKFVPLHFLYRFVFFLWHNLCQFCFLFWAYFVF